MSADLHPRTIEGLLAERAWLRRLARRLVRDEATAEDLTQDTLVAALERAPGTVRSPRAWLATVLRNRTRNRARAERRRRIAESTRGGPTGTPETLDTLARAELVERLGRAVLELPEIYRDAVLLRFFEEEPPRRVARRLGVPVETVRTRLRRATAILAKRMDETPGGRRAWAGALLAWSRTGGAAVLATAIGVIAMKKSMVAAVAVLLLAVGAAIRWWPEGTGHNTAARENPVAEVRDTGDSSAPGVLQGLPAQEADDVRSLAGTGRLRGVVIDEAARPVAGVPVWVGLPPERVWLQFNEPTSLERGLPSFAPLAEATSGTDGTFEVRGVAYGRRVGVEARPDPPRRGSYAGAEIQPWSDPRVVLVVGEGSAMRGRVVDAAGRGVVAWVEGHQPLSTGRAVNWSGRWHAGPTRTDEDGRFAWPAVLSGYVQVQAMVPGGAARRGFVVATPAKGEVLVRLQEPGGAAVAGTVRRLDGGPIAGATVVVESREEIGALIPDTTLGQAVTDGSGRYSITGLLPGRIQSVTARAPGFVPPASWQGYQAPLPAGETVLLDLTLVRGIVANGRVVDSEDRPVAGARVTASPEFTSPDVRGYLLRFEADSDDAGRFRLDGLPLLPVRFLASKEGFAADWSEPLHPASEGETLDVTLSMRPVARRMVTGTASDEQGRPVPGTLVTAVAPIAGARPGNPDVVRAVECAPDGSFRLAGLEADRSWRLLANAPGHASAATDVPPGASHLHLVLRRQGVIEGRVLGPDGAGLPDVRVTCTTPTGAVLEGNSTLDGGFDFRGLEAGTHRVRAFDRRGSPSGEDVPVLVAPGRSSLVDVRVAALHPLRGVVVDASGRRLPTRNVHLERAGTQTDLDGRFEMLFFEPGEFALSLDNEAMPGTYATGPVEHRLVWDPRRRREVEVELTAADGPAIEGGLVWLREGTGAGGASRMGGGRFRGELDASTTRFDVEVAWVSDGAGRRLNVKPTLFRDLDPARSPFTFALEPGRVVRGRVVDPAGGGLPHVAVFVGRRSDLESYRMQPGPLGAHEWRTDLVGRFEAVGLPAEELLVAVRPPEGWVEPRVVALGPGQNEVSIALERGTSVSGVVRDAEGRPVAGSAIRVSAWAERQGVSGDDPLAPLISRHGWNATTDAEGRFVVDGLPASARVSVTATGPAPLLAATLGDVRAGGNDLELRLSSGAYVEGEVVGEGWGLEDEFHVDVRHPGERWPGRALFEWLHAGERRLRVGPLEPGAWTVAVRASGFATDLATVDVVAPATGVRLTIPTARHVVGRLVGDDVAKFEIAVRVGERTVTTSVDASGRFRIQNVEVGPVSVYAWRDGDPRLGLVEGAEPSGPITVRLEPGLEIAGRVEGLPSGLKEPLQLSVRTPWAYRTTTGTADGSFRMTGLPPGRYEVDVWCPVPDGMLHATDVAAGTTDLRLRCGPR